MLLRQAPPAPHSGAQAFLALRGVGIEDGVVGWLRRSVQWFSKMRPREWYSSPVVQPCPRKMWQKRARPPQNRKTAKLRTPRSLLYFQPWRKKHGLSRTTGVWVIWEWSEWSVQTSGIPRNQPLVQCGLYLWIPGNGVVMGTTNLPAFTR